MTHPVTGIDHCFALVGDLEHAAEQYKALGFTLSPRGTHSPSKGTANYTIMFPRDYFELLGILSPTDLNAPRRKMLAERGQGLHAIACRIDDAENAAAALADLGIPTKDLGSFARPVTLPDGTEAEAAFSTVSFCQDDTPLGIVFMCQHKTRETVWIKELLDHPNTACGLDAILAISEAASDDAASLARLWAKGEVTSQDGWLKVHTGPQSAPVILATKDAFAKAYPDFDLTNTAKGAFAGLRVKVGNLNKLKDCLAAANVPNSSTALGVAVAPEDAAGVMMEFVTA
ncbi:MAG: VOC family protein [Thalassovita sp.]